MQKGFTNLELIVVLISVGLIVFMAIPRMDERGSTTTKPSPATTAIAKELRTASQASLVLLRNGNVSAVSRVTINDRRATIFLVMPQYGNTTVDREISDLAPDVIQVVSPDGDQIAYAKAARKYVRLSVGLPATTTSPAEAQ